MSTTAARTASRWIISPTADLLYVVASPIAIVPIVWWLYRRTFTPEQISLAVIAFATLGHHLPGFMRAYGDRELFSRFRWRFLLTPPLMLLTALLFAPPPSIVAISTTWWKHLHGLEIVLFFWGTWHGLMQTYGFMRIYDLKRGVNDRRTARLDHLLCLGMFACGVVFSDVRVYRIMELVWNTGIPIVGPDWLAAARWTTAGATLLVAALWLHNIWRLRRAGHAVNLIKLSLAASTGLLYWFSGRVSTNLLIGVAMFEIFHALQYYAIVWSYNRRQLDRLGERFGLLGFLFRDRWSMLGLYLAAIAAFGSLYFFTGGPEGYLGAGGATDVKAIIMALFVASTLLHYYFDGFIWKVSESETRRNLDIQADGGLRPRLTPAMAHAGKWTLFFVIVAALAVVELRIVTADSDPAARREQILTALAAWTPELPELQSRQSRRLLREGKIDAALDAARRAARLRPRSYAALADLGAALLAAGRPADAEAAFRRAVELSPTDAQNHYALATAQVVQRRFDEAEQTLRRAIQLAPQRTNYHVELGKILESQGDLPEAAVSYQRALTLQPDSLRSRFRLLNVYARTGQWDAARRLVEEAIARRADSPWTDLMRGLMYNYERRYEDAAEALRRALRLRPQSTEAYFPLGLALMNAGRPAEAQAAFQQALRRDKDDRRALFHLAVVEYQQGHIDRAIAGFRACAARIDDLPQAYRADVFKNLGVAYQHESINRIEAAEAAYHESLQYKPGQIDVLKVLGHIYQQRGDTDRAEEFFRRANR